ncbi:MAG: hypothetical protein QGI05_03865 [Candidatus Omnitrophota bacterium]|jgi:hypothetical protein|nr:hypothetical protein [Candidatus Omnitrophota bacterium]
MILAVLIVLATGFGTTSVSEHKIADRERDVIQVLWLAEAGLDNAIANLPTTPISGTLGTGKSYSTTTTAVSSTRYLIISKGGIPATDETDPSNIVRQISAIVEQPAVESDPSGVTSAITANGDVTVRGSAEVEGDIDENFIFDFTETFGVSKETMEQNATNLYTNPANNVTPVDSLTWINVDAGDELQITESTWNGSGILIVNGDLKITGGNFSGVLWVIGTLSVSGNPDIDGAIYVESGAEIETSVTGNPEIEFDDEAVSDAFDFIPSDLPPQLISWKED